MRDPNFPRFPATPYLTRVNSTTSSDVVAESGDFEKAKLQASTTVIEEKLDGANVRICFDGRNELLVGNRDHVLRKGFLKDTPAKLQFRPLWTWIYDHRDRFAALADLLHVVPVLYGEWLYARHTIRYTKLPELLVPFDLWVDTKFMDPVNTRAALDTAGFILPPRDPPDDGSSAWSNEPREGVVIKFGDTKRLIARFKNVRADFVPRGDFTTSELERNQLQESK